MSRRKPRSERHLSRRDMQNPHIGTAARSEAQVQEARVEGTQQQRLFAKMSHPIDATVFIETLTTQPPRHTRYTPHNMHTNFNMLSLSLSHAHRTGTCIQVLPDGDDSCIQPQT